MDSVKIILPFPPSSNTAYPTVIKGGKPIRVKSAALNKWLKSAPLLDEKIEGKCVISYKLFPPDRRVRDGQSYFKVVTDYLVKQGVIPDDNMNIVVGEQWTLGGIDKENPRVEIIIKGVE